MRSDNRSSIPRWVTLAMVVLGLGAGADAVSAQDKPQGRASKVEYDGWRQYMVNCARCHGDDAVGGVIAPDLRASVAKGAADAESFATIVSEGRRDKGMPAFKGVMTDEQIAATYAYVKARAEQRLPAGRPKQ